MKGKDVLSMTDSEFRTLVKDFAGERAENVDLTPDPRFSERHDNPTPSGGAYSIAYFYDKRHNPCERSEAAFICIVEYDSNNRRINETYAPLGNNKR